MSDRIFLALVAGQQDEQGRITSHRGMWTMHLGALGPSATRAYMAGLLGGVFGSLASALLGKLFGQGFEDTPEVREALGLPPRLVVTRDDGGVGVAGVADA